MKIAFVNFGRENLGIEYISSVLKRDGFEVILANDPGLFTTGDNVFYLSFLGRLFERKKLIIEEIVKSNPQIVAFSVYTPTYRWACDIAAEIKKRLSVKIVFGGIHPTLLAEKVIKHDFVDFIIRGEGEYSFLELVRGLTNNSSLEHIKNLWGKINGTIVKNELRPPIKNLDELPLPDKQLFEKDVRFKDDYMIMTSKGCPYSCNYCCESYLNKIYKNRSFRRRSVGSVMEELEIMKEKYNIKEVMFFDDVFFTDKIWLKNLITQYKKKVGVPFRCIGHVNFFDYEIGKLLKDGGCYCIDFGIQTFNQKVRKEILNRIEDNSQIGKVFNICDSLKLRYDVDLMFGLPAVSEKDYALAIDFMKESKYFNRLKCYYLAYYPKLTIVDKAKQLGILSDRDIEEIENGKVGDWFHIDSIKNVEHKRWKENFQKFYKIYPIIPLFLRKFIIRQKLYRSFHLIPVIFIVFIQLIIGIWRKDYRFKIYINNYLHHFKKYLLRYF